MRSKVIQNCRTTIAEPESPFANDQPTPMLIVNLMLQQSQRSLDHDVLEDGSGRNVDGAAFCSDNNDRALESDSSAEIDGSGDSEMVKLDNLGDAADALLKIRDLLEVVAKLDERSWAETIGVNCKLAVLQRV